MNRPFNPISTLDNQEKTCILYLKDTINRGRAMKRYLSVIIAALIALIGSVMVSAKTVTVPGDAVNIQAGIDLAENYDTVMVLPGAYLENLSILDRVVSIIGVAGPEETILQPLDPDSPVLTVYKWTRNEDASKDGFRCQLSGFTVTGAKNSSSIFIDLFSNLEISGNIFYGNILETNADRAVIECHGDSGAPTISRNIFYGNFGTTCVSVLGGAAEVFNNTFHANRSALLSSSDRTIAVNNIMVNSIGTAVDGAFMNLDYNDIWGNGLNYG
jgi:hypothetical protein